MTCDSERPGGRTHTHKTKPRREEPEADKQGRARGAPGSRTTRRNKSHTEDGTRRGPSTQRGVNKQSPRERESVGVLAARTRDRQPARGRRLAAPERFSHTDDRASDRGGRAGGIDAAVRGTMCVAFASSIQGPLRKVFTWLLYIDVH